MKKLAKWLGLTVVAVCLAVSMAACGNEKLEGKYIYKETYVDEEDGVEHVDEFVIELKTNGTFIMKATYYEDGKIVDTSNAEEDEIFERTGTYTIVEDEIIFKDGHESFVAKIDKGKSIALLVSGDDLVLYKK